MHCISHWSQQISCILNKPVYASWNRYWYGAKVTSECRIVTVNRLQKLTCFSLKGSASGLNQPTTPPTRKRIPMKRMPLATTTPPIFWFVDKTVAMMVAFSRNRIFLKWNSLYWRVAKSNPPSKTSLLLCRVLSLDFTTTFLTLLLFLFLSLSLYFSRTIRSSKHTQCHCSSMKRTHTQFASLSLSLLSSHRTTFSHFISHSSRLPKRHYIPLTHSLSLSFFLLSFVLGSETLKLFSPKRPAQSLFFLVSGKLHPHNIFSSSLWHSTSLPPKNKCDTLALGSNASTSTVSASQHTRWDSAWSRYLRTSSCDRDKC